MAKKFFFLFTALVFTATTLASCEPQVTPEPEPQPQDTIPVELQDLKQSVAVTENWVYETRPNFTIHIENPNAVNVEAKVIAKITTDLKKAVTTIETVVAVPANGTLDVPITTTEDLQPGFYRANCIVNNKGARSFNFGISPEKIVSAPDMQDDFNEYWAAAKEQLEAIDMNAQLTELEKKSTDKRKI